MIDTSKLSQREKMLWGSFRLESPPSPSNSKFILESYARFCEAKRADIVKQEETEKIQQANPYRTRATTHSVVADSKSGTGIF
jgi:hypothetical protein